MTDFISSLLSSMATKFNEATENIKIDLTEDKTMKWRGLLNNKFAAGKRGENKYGGKRIHMIPSSSSSSTSNVNNGGGNTEGSVATSSSSSSSSSSSLSSMTTVLFSPGSMAQQSNADIIDDKTTVMNDGDNSSQINNYVASAIVTDKTKRVLRRKRSEIIEKKVVMQQPKKRKRQAKNNEDNFPASDSLIPTDTTITATEKNRKRRGRIRKLQNPSLLIEDKAVIQHQPSQIASPNTITMNLSTLKQHKNNDKPEKHFRKSERSQSECFVVENIPIVIVEDGELLASNCPANSPVHIEKSEKKSPPPPCEINKPIISIEKNEDKTMNEENQESKQELIIDGQNEKNNSSTEQSTTKYVIAEIKDEKDDKKSSTNNIGVTINDVKKTPHQPQPPVVHIPKKRGRKPGTKLKPKIDPLKYDDGDCVDAVVTVKKSLRLSKDSNSTSGDSVLASAMARREKINKQVTPPQRLSRRIKPTAKILANDELRYGFELQNNARRNIISNNNNNNDVLQIYNQLTASDILKAENETENMNAGDIKYEDNTSTTMSINLTSEKNGKQFKEETLIKSSTTPSAPVEQNVVAAAISTATKPPPLTPPQRRPCRDPVEFLNEIKQAKINLHRSPEDNKKLNFKQKRRLIKLKEKHLNKLGLQKTIKLNGPNSDSSDIGSSESDDVEEFVPNKKIQVAPRPSITLRIRNNTTQQNRMPDEKAHSKIINDECTTAIAMIAKKDRRLSMSNNSQTNIKLGEILKCHENRQKSSHSQTTIDNNNVTIPVRNHEKHLLLSTRHKGQSQQKDSLLVSLKKVTTKQQQHHETPPTICLCSKLSKYYAKKSTETQYCQAVDEIDSKYIGCCNEVCENNDNEINDTPLIHLLRPSVRVSYMILCRHHVRRLFAHNCCAGCGIFCTQGEFFVCLHNHIFHRQCATKFILSTPFTAHKKNRQYFPYPTLLLKCPHCGTDAPHTESTVKMTCRSVPVFCPTQQKQEYHHHQWPTVNVNIRTAKLSIDLQHIKDLSKNDEFFCTLDRMVPERILNLVTAAQNNFPFSCSHNYETKDIFLAVHKNDIDRVAEIIASGFDITNQLPEYHNGTCLHLAANSGSLDLVYLILSRSASIDFLNIVDRELRSAVMCTVVSNRNDILRILVQCGADVTLKGSDGMTALHFAAKIGNFEAIRIMLEHYRMGVNAQQFEEFLNACDDGGWTAIVWAAENGHSDLVVYFVQCGCECGLRDAENNTVLHWAIMSDDMETIVPLLQRMEYDDLNLQNLNGDTPLHIACRNSNTQLCLMLMLRGACLDIKNIAGELPFDCIPNENSQCAKVIQFNMTLRKLSTRSIGERTIILCQDISNGREYYPIKMVRKYKNQFPNIVEEIDECALPDFKYITKTILLQNTIQIDQRISQMRICSCSDNCTTQSCQCSEISVQNWYNLDGRLNGQFNYRDPAMIFECSDVCGCNKLLCKNRVVQRGTRCPLQIIECTHKSKGWGVIGLTNIPKGTFIAEYTGEILTDIEADRRTDDSYFFDLGASEHCIDANYYGNISRFFNHSCDPNIVPIRVYFEHQDLRFPKIAFFACRDIDAGHEITFDYGEKFWLIKYKSFTCQCDAPECRFSTETIQKTLDEYNQRLNRPSN